MFVRQAQQTDVPRIAEIHVQTWQRAYRGVVPDSYLDALSIAEREATWAKILAEPEAYLLVIEETGSVIGWLAGGRSRDADADAKTAEIYAIYVDPAHWRCRAGRMLWERARAHFTFLGCLCVTLWVLEDNRPARAFYEALAFRIDPNARKAIERGGQVLCEVRYAAELGAPSARLHDGLLPD